MTRPNELPKAYDAASVEKDIFKAWEASGAFAPQGNGEPYCIVLPPPNRTGTLHLGHAVMLAVEDLLIRFHRMTGRKTYWVPGTDHAAISTQVKVEQLLIKEGMKDPRRELGREKFLEKVRAFAQSSRDTIVDQCKAMGSSMDWTREKYTLDEERNKAVNEVFRMMSEDGLIERGFRVVNWDPQFKTTLSDDEVLHKEMQAELVTFTYDKDFPIAISTTRAETKFGDTAVAVHPDDARYGKFVGKTLKATYCGKPITVVVIADKEVDPTFGTGALGVTPAHSMVDADMAERHGLPMVQVIGPDGRMTDEAGPGFAGLTTLEARKKAIETLEAAGCVLKKETVAQNLMVAERGEGIVEQLPMKQWFIRVNKPFAVRQNTLGKWKKGSMATLKDLMREAVESKQIRIVPERFEKTYFHWIDNLRDWCISRQIWFGHRIPVWYKTGRPEGSRSDEGPSNWNSQREDLSTPLETTVSSESPGDGWEQDPDTLDTWFSSGLWTFSTLGWPDNASIDKKGNLVKTGELAEFHPTSVLETGYDILFFWIARMVLMSAYALGEVPFKDVYLHGLVRDEQGRKMSKSLGNVIDPLTMIGKYGTDAVRLALVLGTTPGQDQKLSEEKIEGFRNFTNKLWNISRFILMQIGDVGAGSPRPGAETAPLPVTLADTWILARLAEVTASVTKKIESYELSSAGEELRDFTWGDLADWYLEIAKVEKGKEAILSHVLKTILTLWHPFMPFVTENIWENAGFEGQLIVTDWPKAESFKVSYLDASMQFGTIRQLVTDMRRLRAENGVDSKSRVEFSVRGPETDMKIIEENMQIVVELAKACCISFKEVSAKEKELWSFGTSGPFSVALLIAGTIDVEKENTKIAKELKETEEYVASLETKLGNKEFTSKAPAKVVDEMKAKKAEAETKVAALKERIGKLG